MVFVTHGRQVAGVHIVMFMAIIDPDLWSHQRNVLCALKKKCDHHKSTLRRQAHASTFKMAYLTLDQKDKKKK